MEAPQTKSRLWSKAGQCSLPPVLLRAATRFHPAEKALQQQLREPGTKHWLGRGTMPLLLTCLQHFAMHFCPFQNYIRFVHLQVLGKLGLRTVGPQGPPSTLLYPVSLLIGGWDWVQDGNPLYAAVKCLSGRRGQIWQIFFQFFPKSTWHTHSLHGLFLAGSTKFFCPLKLAIF